MPDFGEWMVDKERDRLAEELAESRTEIERLTPKRSIEYCTGCGWLGDLPPPEERTYLSCCPERKTYPIPVEAADEIERLRESRKRDCVAFFRWFWNQPGTNAEQAYDVWAQLTTGDSDE